MKVLTTWGRKWVLERGVQAHIGGYGRSSTSTECSDLYIQGGLAPTLTSLKCKSSKCGGDRDADEGELGRVRKDQRQSISKGCDGSRKQD